MCELTVEEAEQVAGGLANNPFDGPGTHTPIVIFERDVPKAGNPFD